MGAGQSFPQYSNDFELVIRVSKELEHTLRTKILHRSATTRPGDLEPSLMEMINQVEHLFSRNTIQEMRGLVRCTFLFYEFYKSTFVRVKLSVDTQLFLSNATYST